MLMAWHGLVGEIRGYDVTSIAGRPFSADLGVPITITRVREYGVGARQNRIAAYLQYSGAGTAGRPAVIQGMTVHHFINFFLKEISVVL
jgi:hypothetical protein